MGLVLNTDLVRVRVNGICDGQAVLNILDYTVSKSGGAAPGTSVLELLTSFRAIWRSNILPLLCSTYSVTDYSAVVINGRTVQPPAAGPARFTYGEKQYYTNTGAADSGVVATPDSPTFVSASGVKRTLKAGRQQYGGIRMSPIPIATVTENTMTVPAQTAWNTAFTFLTSFAGTGVGDICQLVIFHQAHYLGRMKTPGLSDNPSPAANADNVTLILCRKYAGSQVSRKRKRLIGQ